MTRTRFSILLGLMVWAWDASASAAERVVRWGFGTEETTRLRPHGGVHRDQPGPRPPEFPDFDPDNTAVKLDGSGAHFSLADPGRDSPFDFTNGDAITLEAWVKLADLRPRENLYVIGKGRTAAPGQAQDNQNWALRIREVDGEARVSFLFATPRRPGAPKDAHWHRWTSSRGFDPGSGWHHVAVTYTFGDPKSIRGWLDGKPLPGSWDMGGATTEAPVVDDDAIWIGSSSGGSPGNSFRGLLDEIAIYRGIVPDEELRTRYRREGPPPMSEVKEVMPEVAGVPPGQVLVTFHEGLPTHDRWPAQAVPPETARWLTGAFVFPRLPHRFDDWGIRQAWKAPVLLRATADVRLPPGNHEFLVRSRGLSRLWVNGQLIVRTPPHAGATDGHDPVPPVPDPPVPGMRPVGYGDREARGEGVVPADGRCRVVLEVMVGGKKFRPEPGEMCVAVQLAPGQPHVLLQASAAPSLPLTDTGWEMLAQEAEKSLSALDDSQRRQRAATQDAYWQRRHEFARRWAAENPAPPVPQLPDTPHPIDAFLKARINQALASAGSAEAAAARRFHESVLPILAQNCFRCHGEKEKGGLRLNSRQAALQAGDSGKAAVVPGKPAESLLLARVKATDEAERMPPNGAGLKPEQIAVLEQWIADGAPWPAPPVTAEEVAQPSVLVDTAFLRRVTFDTIGLPPTDAEVREFLADFRPDKRQRVIDRLLADERGADHWISYWQDVLAENPNMLKPSLNNTGPFRWFLYDAFRDDKPVDRWVTELILMRGAVHEGGSAGFGMAADNDAPFAAKGHILGTAFLGIELQCARCHDSPYHSTKQRDLYALAAMLQRKPATVPKTSSVPPAFFEKKARESLIKVTLRPGEPVEARWPFAEVCGSTDDARLDPWLNDPKDTRERLAALITMPQNRRFAAVMVNRVWKRLMGAGLVEPAHDWEGRTPSHPELLAWLAHELVSHDYQIKHVIRLILTSQAYQREARGSNLAAPPERRFFAAPDRRRLTAEQVVDALFAAGGKAMNVEEITFDPDSRRPASSMINLGAPRRAWMFATLSNERDRPSLSLPRAQAVVDVLEAFGWTGSRQNPRTDRETDPNVLQPGVLANSVMVSWITRVSADSELARLAREAASPEELVETLFLRFLTRSPSAEERRQLADFLRPGFSDRRLPPDRVRQPAPLPRLPKVSWATHLRPEANEIKLEMQRRCRAGDPPDPRLDAAWRERLEDVIWSLLNSPEFVWLP